MSRISEYRTPYFTDFSISYYDGKPELGMELRTYQKNGKTRFKLKISKDDLVELRKELDICINGLEE